MDPVPGLPKRPVSFTLLAWAMTLNVVITIAVILLISKIGYEGFKGGEMGIMVGFFGIVGVVLAIPLLVLFIYMVRGLFRIKKWSVIISLIFTIIGLLASPLTLTAGIVAFLFSLGYLLVILYLEIRCLRHLSFQEPA